MSTVYYHIAQGRLTVARFLNSLPIVGHVGRLVNRGFWGFANFINGAPNHRPLPPPMAYEPPAYVEPPTPPRPVTMGLSRLQEVDPEAYAKWVDLLASDCPDSFWVGDDGSLHAEVDQTGDTFTFKEGIWYHDDEMYEDVECEEEEDDDDHTLN